VVLDDLRPRLLATAQMLPAPGLCHRRLDVSWPAIPRWAQYAHAPRSWNDLGETCSWRSSCLWTYMSLFRSSSSSGRGIFPRRSRGTSPRAGRGAGRVVRRAFWPSAIFALAVSCYSCPGDVKRHPPRALCGSWALCPGRHEFGPLLLARRARPFSPQQFSPALGWDPGRPWSASGGLWAGVFFLRPASKGATAICPAHETRDEGGNWAMLETPFAGRPARSPRREPRKKKRRQTSLASCSWGAGNGGCLGGG